MRAFVRLLRFTWFTLLDYLRSGRILVELIAAVAFFYLFLTPRGDVPIEAGQFFALTGLFSLALTLYTVSSFMGMSDRPQGYLLLARHLDRGSYLLGFYLAALAVVFGIYGLERGAYGRAAADAFFACLLARLAAHRVGPDRAGFFEQSDQRPSASITARLADQAAYRRPVCVKLAARAAFLRL